jgi:hypothetical protein
MAAAKDDGICESATTIGGSLVMRGVDALIALFLSGELRIALSECRERRKNARSGEDGGK